MRTTLEIDDDVLSAAKKLSAKRGLPTGKVLSELARQAMNKKKNPKTRNGVPLFPRNPGGKAVTMGLVNRLRDESS